MNITPGKLYRQKSKTGRIHAISPRYLEESKILLVVDITEYVNGIPVDIENDLNLAFSGLLDPEMTGKPKVDPTRMTIGFLSGERYMRWSMSEKAFFDEFEEAQP